MSNPDRFSNPAPSGFLLAVSLIAGIAYPLVSLWLIAGFGIAADAAGKGVAVTALALAAGGRAWPGHWWLAAIMAAGATGDILLAIPGLFIAGGAAFAIGHLLATVFYMQQKSAVAAAWHRVAAAALIGWGLLMPNLLMPGGAPVGALMLYGVLLGGMAAAALLSRFDRRLVAAGAVLFVISDTLLVARLGGHFAGYPRFAELAVWYSYYAAQLLVFTGVARGLVSSARGAAPTAATMAR
jgi:uncharacterized membrane protein YhhN